MINKPQKSEDLALARHAAVSWIQEAVKQHFTLARALSLASERAWGGKFYSASTLEHWHYTFRSEGFQALQRRPRKDKGARKALSPEASEAILNLRRQHPQLKVKVLVRQLADQGVLQPGTFGMSSIYRLLAGQGLDSKSVKQHQGNGFAAMGPNGPTKAFEFAHANELWMTDMAFGPTLRLPNGQVVQTRLFALLDDCSRLVTHAQYYPSEKLRWFLDCFRQAVARRGFPGKLYTDRGKIYTSHHLRIVCANLGVKLIHAKPYAAWSKGKIERWLRTVQEDFEARLAIEPARDLEELNQRFWRWIETEYHRRVHGALQGQSPAERFSQRALNLRTADPQADWERLFLSRAERRARLDATISLEGTLWETPVHLRGHLVEVHYDPFEWKRVEIWFKGRFCALAVRCDKIINSKTFTHRDGYERPDKSA